MAVSVDDRDIDIYYKNIIIFLKNPKFMILIFKYSDRIPDFLKLCIKCTSFTIKININIVYINQF